MLNVKGVLIGVSLLASVATFAKSIVIKVNNLKTVTDSFKIMEITEARAQLSVSTDMFSRQDGCHRFVRFVDAPHGSVMWPYSVKQNLEVQIGSKNRLELASFLNAEAENSKHLQKELGQKCAMTSFLTLLIKGRLESGDDFRSYVFIRSADGRRYLGVSHDKRYSLVAGKQLDIDLVPAAMSHQMWDFEWMGMDPQDDQLSGDY